MDLKGILYPPISSNRVIITFAVILLFALFIDGSLLKIYTFLNSIQNTDQQNLTFVFIVIAFVVGQYCILAVVRSRIKEIGAPRILINTVHKFVTISQYILSLILLVIIAEIILYSHYNTLLLSLITMISYGLSCIALGILALRFFLWFRSKRSYSILFYGLSSSVFVISNLFLMVFIMHIIPQAGDVVRSHVHRTLYFNDPGSFGYVLYNGYVITSILSFIITWIATSIILHYYSKKVGKIKYWIIVSLPLVYFLSQFIPLFLNLFNPILGQNLFLYMVFASVIFAVSKAAGGILFGIVFWIMSRKMNKNKALRHFLIIITIGFMLLFVSEQAVSLISLPIPPFGLVSVATLGLSSYLILIGLYYSAISISTDIEFRKFIRASTIKELTFLGKIGSAEKEKETEKIVNRLIRQNLEEVKSQIGNTQPENVKGYIDDIMDEIKRVKEKP